MALLGLLGVGAALHGVHEAFPAVLSLYWQKMLDGVLYTIWGGALGKRSRDLGTTFTYGMLVGMLVPVIGVVFLFQEGKKEKDQARERAARPATGSQAVNR